MKILHLVHQCEPVHVGGTDLHTQMVSCGLAQLGHVVAVFCREDGSGAQYHC